MISLILKQTLFDDKIKIALIYLLNYKFHINKPSKLSLPGTRFEKCEPEQNQFKIDILAPEHGPLPRIR